MFLKAAWNCAGVHSAGSVVAGVLLCAFVAAAVEQIDYNLLFRWFAGLGIEDEVEPCGVLEEPRQAADQRCGTALLRRIVPEGQTLYEGRAR